MTTRRRALADTSVLIGLETVRVEADALKDYELGVSAVTLGELRLGVLQARDPVIAAVAECEAVCEHIHLPLQSGSSRILKASWRPAHWDVVGDGTEHSFGEVLAREYLAVKRSEVRGFAGKDVAFEIEHHFYKY